LAGRSRGITVCQAIASGVENCQSCAVRVVSEGSARSSAWGFEDASTIHSQNTVEFARFVAPDVLIIHGRFRPNVGEQELPFIQLRVKQRDEWLLSKLWLFLSPKEKR
jgi:hypothetical protein